MTPAPKLVSSHSKEPDVLEKLRILGRGQKMNNECLDYLVKLESKETIKTIRVVSNGLDKADEMV